VSTAAAAPSSSTSSTDVTLPGDQVGAGPPPTAVVRRDGATGSSGRPWWPPALGLAAWLGVATAAGRRWRRAPPAGGR
jgi:hypothetical protein